MTAAIPDPTAEPQPAKSWQPNRLPTLASRLCQAVDLIILGAVFFSIVILPFFHQAEEHLNLTEFLQLRVSLRNVLVAVLALSSWRMILWASGIYRPRRTRTFRDYLMRSIIGINGCTALVCFIVTLIKTKSNLRVWDTAETFWILAFTGMAIARAAMLVFDLYVRPRLRHRRNLIIVGSGERALKVYEECLAHVDWDYRLVGFIHCEEHGSHVPANLLLGNIDDLESILMHQVVDEVVIALPMKSQYELVGRAIEICQMLGVQAQYFTDYFGSALTKRRASAGPQSGRVVLEVVHTDFRLAFKRALDFTLALLGLIVFSPAILITAAAVKLTSPGPIFFHQERFGLNKRTFFMHKFRSMCVDAESRQSAVEHLNETSGPAFKIKHDPRVTPIGHFLRKMSLDELPQLWNVLMGEMSLVGPRPLPLRDVNRFSEAWLMRRFSVKPGVTCLWQIGGRSNTDFDRWIQLDLQYIDHWSLSLDLLILLRTIPAVLTSRGAS